MASFEEQFVEAVRAGGDKRKRAFDFFEEQHGANFRNGEKGFKFYCDLLEVVKRAGSEQAVKEYQDRFVKLCDQEWLGKHAVKLFQTAIEEQGAEAEQELERKREFLDEVERAELQELRRREENRKKGLLRRLFGG